MYSASVLCDPETANVDITQLFRKHRIIVTQRYHGIILSELSGVPYVNIHHHNKLKFAHPQRCPSVQYHGLQKDSLSTAIETALNTKLEPYVVARRVYDDIVDRMIKELIVKKRDV
jgi:polysaccharide pyruvyl transferase WcaK-like protein